MKKVNNTEILIACEELNLDNLLTFDQPLEIVSNIENLINIQVAEIVITTLEDSIYIPGKSDENTSSLSTKDIKFLKEAPAAPEPAPIADGGYKFTIATGKYLKQQANHSEDIDDESIYLIRRNYEPIYDNLLSIMFQLTNDINSDQLIQPIGYAIGSHNKKILIPNIDPANLINLEKNNNPLKILSNTKNNFKLQDIKLQDIIITTLQDREYDPLKSTNIISSLSKKDIEFFK